MKPDLFEGMSIETIETPAVPAAKPTNPSRADLRAAIQKAGKTALLTSSCPLTLAELISCNSTSQALAGVFATKHREDVAQAVREAVALRRLVQNEVARIEIDACVARSDETARVAGPPIGDGHLANVDNGEATKVITLFARRWFRKSVGSTYHSVEIHVNGKLRHKIEYAYGYGNQYQYTACEWLWKNGYIPGVEKNESLWRYCERHGITLTEFCNDVSRKKDM